MPLLKDSAYVLSFLFFINFNGFKILNYHFKDNCIYCYKSLLNNRIKIAHSDALPMISSTLNYYEKEISRHKKLITQIRTQNDSSTKLIEGLLLNLENLKEVDSKVSDLLGNVRNNHEKSGSFQIDYLNSLEYLKRDWTYSKEGEREIYKIIKALKKAINFISQEKHNALILGAGSGRLSIEIAGILNQHCIAIDTSLTMAYWFDKLKESPIFFAEINLRNNFFTKNRVILQKAYLKKSLFKNYSLIKYVVADALNLPFKKNSFTILFSIYFTDVVLLTKLIQETTRVLIKGGYYIHFGPLNYHFKNIFQMLSAEEVVDNFKLAGFTLIYEDVQLIESFKKVDGLKEVYYRNLVYVFKKEI